MKNFQIIPKIFDFKKPSGTSRGVMTKKKSWFICLHENGKFGWGECSVIEGLSPDYDDDQRYESQLKSFLMKWQNDELNVVDLALFPSIRFGIETAILDLQQGGSQNLFDTDFVKGTRKIQINGLIWMGAPDFLRNQIREKIDLGFRCIKMKIGAINWQEEFEILKSLRKEFGPSDIEIRVDANGAFSYDAAQDILKQLSELTVHSIEQPILAGQIEEMAQLCESTPCPIALDEELIQVYDSVDREVLLSTIKPQYIILKPSLHGGISGTQDWISIANQQDIPWWMTSALESNLGLNAVAQVASSYKNHLPQGLGTGSLYVDNIDSPLFLEGEWLGFEPNKPFDLPIAFD